MYEYLNGTLAEKTPTTCVIDAGGIGYFLEIPLNTYSELPHEGAEIKLFVSFVVKEDSQKFFGFTNKEHRALFDKVRSISGIGPKTALSIVGQMQSIELFDAIASANTIRLSKIPGIGKKTAERLVIELRDHVQKQTISFKTDLPDHAVSDAINALLNLGYNHLQAQKAVKAASLKASKDATASDLISGALQGL